MAEFHIAERFVSINGEAAHAGELAVFLRFTGCNLHCSYCDTAWANAQDAPYTVYTTQELCEYVRETGVNNVTLTGGEPLLQAPFVSELFALCHREGLHTCLDTSGCMLTDEVKELLGQTDRVLLDVKYTTDADYRENVGCGINAPMAFLDYLTEQRIPTTLRQVIIPTVNDSEEQILRLRQISRTHKNVDKVELLPFRKLCTVKYDNMGIEFPFAHLPEPTREQMQRLEGLLK